MVATMDDDTDNAESPAAQVAMHNRMIMAQIDSQLRQGFGAAMKGADYYVIRSEVTGVLSVLSSSTVDDDKNIEFGPKPFKQCIEYVNSSVVTRLAARDSLGEAPRNNAQREKEQSHEPTRVD